MYLTIHYIQYRYKCRYLYNTHIIYIYIYRSKGSTETGVSAKGVAGRSKRVRGRGEPGRAPPTLKLPLRLRAPKEKHPSKT